MAKEGTVLVPCCRPPSGETLAPLCKMGENCYHVRVYCILKNLNLLWYSSEITPETYEEKFSYGICGCTFRHENEQLQKIDQDVRTILENTTIKQELHSKIVQMYGLAYKVNGDKHYRGYACDMNENHVGPTNFPHFTMSTIFTNDDQVQSSTMSSAEAHAAIERVRNFGTTGRIWSHDLEKKLHNADETMVITQPPAKKTALINVPVPLSETSLTFAKKAVPLRGTDDLSIFPELPITDKNSIAPPAYKARSQVELQLEKERSETQKLERELAAARRQADDRKNRVAREELRLTQQRNDAIRAEIQKIKQETLYL
jgi:hypothetical protein